MEARILIQFRWLAVLLVLSFLPSPAWPQHYPAALPAASQAEELTLEQAIALALRENRKVKVARLEVDKFADRLAAAKTHRLPELKFTFLAAQLLDSIDFNFKQGDLGILPGIGPVPQTDISVTTPRHPFFFINGH